MGKTTWKSELKCLIQQRWQLDETFLLSDVYEFKSDFQRSYPGNSHIDKKLQQTLQQLREDGIVEFVDYQGTYRRIG
jgi:DNA-binding HxlR family transcriptional regulator